MYPELFKLPFLDVTVKTYGAIMVLGFMLAVLTLRKMSRRVGEDPEHITNAALYALITGVVGARIFYILHHFSDFQGNFGAMFAIWQGGLEFLGGFILGFIVVCYYLFKHKLSLKRFLDMLGVALLLGLAFGRIGCFFSGCCFGEPTNAACGVRFPYGSPSYHSQIRPNTLRGRDEPHLELPKEYFGYFGQEGRQWLEAGEVGKYQAYLKPFELLNDEQRHAVTKGKYRAMKVHPTQLYSSGCAFALFGLLYLFWRKFGITKCGCTLSLVFVLYGPVRFGLEFLRDDNPFEDGWWTITSNLTVSQNLGIYMAVLGLFLLVIFSRIKTTKSS